MKKNRIEHLRTHCKHVFWSDLYSAKAQKAFVRNGHYVGPVGKALVCDGKPVPGEFPVWLASSPNWFENELLRGDDERGLEATMAPLAAKIAACCDGSAERRSEYNTVHPVGAHPFTMDRCGAGK